MAKIDTFSAWLAEVRKQNPPMSGKTVTLSSDNMEKLLRKTWNLAFEAGKQVELSKSESSHNPLESIFGGFTE